MRTFSIMDRLKEQGAVFEISIPLKLGLFCQYHHGLLFAITSLYSCTKSKESCLP